MHGILYSHRCVGQFLSTRAVHGNNIGGGGINISGSPLIEECIIQNNSATRGGGIYVTGSPIIENNIVQNNTVTVAGGGIISYGGEMIINNNLISQNHSEIYGGGIHIETSGFVEIISNRISENTSCPHLG